MILQTLQTLLLTFSIGISANANTNVYNAEKKTRRNAAEQINQTYNFYTYSRYSGYYEQGKGFTLTKYYIQQPNDTASPNLYSGYYNIYNTIYDDYRQEVSTNKDERTVWAIYQINNYYATNIKLRLEISMTVSANQSVYQQNFYVIDRQSDSNLINYIDLSLNESNEIALHDLSDDIGPKTYTESQSNQATSSNDYINSMATSEIEIAAQETVYVYMRMLTQVRYETVNSFQLNSLTVTGMAVIPTDNREIVDIPGLMFTVLTLPFSFISQAFNLTVFPNTPYQVNFSNLFMTIIAIFILLWLIKHIFK